MTTTPDLSDRLRIMLRGGRTRRTESVPAASDWNDPTTLFVRTTASRPRMRLAWAFMWLVVVWTTLLLLLVDPTHSFSLVGPPSRRAARQHRHRHDGCCLRCCWCHGFNDQRSQPDRLVQVVMYVSLPRSDDQHLFCGDYQQVLLIPLIESVIGF